jgi:Fe-S-cluster-containing hydrogenase component 2
MFIDPGACICCASCVPVCPAGAIFDEDDVPTEHADAVEANASFFR